MKNESEFSGGHHNRGEGVIVVWGYSSLLVLLLISISFDDQNSKSTYNIFNIFAIMVATVF